MKNKMCLFFLIIFLLIMPIIIYAASVLTSYGETVTKTNSYIMSFRDRRKYLIFNKNYVYERGGFGDSSSFTMGGLLSKSEYDLSVYMNQSYLANGKEYWTLTDDGTNKYYVDAYIQSKNPSSLSGTRVTEYIKPGTLFSGRGTYSNPWVFDEGHSVDIISNNTNFGTVTPLGERYVRPGESLDYVLTPANGYFYNGNKDECSLVKVGSNKYENNYKIENIRRDITCTAVYELRTYKFNLLVDPSSVDFDGNEKTYTTAPSPEPIYYKYRTNWYSNASTTNVINKITPPTMTGWTFGGYYYGDTKVIDASGNIIVRDLNLGTTNDFVDTDHILYATEGIGGESNKGFSKNTYNIAYNLNGGAFPANAKHPTSAKYDEIVEIDYPTRAGYRFDGWSHNGSSLTAKLKNVSTNATESFIPSTTISMARKFANLTPTLGSTVTMKANWTICPAGTYNTGSSISCAACPGSMTSNPGSTAITDCHISCGAGKYLVKSDSKCTTCTANHYCGGGDYHYNTTTDQGINACPGNMSSDTGKSLITHCHIECAAGKYLAKSNSSCSTCTANHYCGGGDYYYNTTSNQGINACPGSMSSDTGKSLITQCHINCGSGNYLVKSNSSCSTCTANHYCGGGDYYYNTTTDQGINACPGSMTCGTGQGSITSCAITCGAGTYLTAGGSSCSTCTQNYYCGGNTFNYNASSSQGIVACPSDYPNTASTGSSLKTQCRTSVACTNANSNHDGCSVTGSYTGSNSCSISDCNHTGCTAGGSYSSSASCSRTNCNHDGCTASGTYSTTESCSTSSCNHTGCTAGGSYSGSGTCYCTEAGFGPQSYGSCSSDLVCSNYCYRYGPETDGDCVFSSVNCSKTDANHTGCTCTGTWTQSHNCTKSNAGSHSSCSCSGSYATTPSCTKTDSNHTGCTCTGTYSATKSCVKGDSNHTGCTTTGTWYSYSPA